MKIPFSYPSLLAEEYGDNSLIKTRYRGYMTPSAWREEIADRLQSPIQFVYDELGAHNVGPSLPFSRDNLYEHLFDVAQANPLPVILGSLAPAAGVPDGFEFRRRELWEDIEQQNFQFVAADSAPGIWGEDFNPGRFAL